VSVEGRREGFDGLTMEWEGFGMALIMQEATVSGFAIFGGARLIQTSGL